MQFVWFWTFWHWSSESHRCGAVLLDPLQGIGGHWDEWFRHEASEAERRQIAETGRTEAGQRRFVGWLVRCWAGEIGRGRNRSIVRYALRQLSLLPPFLGWAVLAKYRAGYRLGGVAAIVLAEESRGGREDVREVEALLVPGDAAAGGRSLVPEGFTIEPGELETVRAAAGSVLGGKGLGTLLALWIAAGRRPYPRWFAILLAAGWLAVGAGIVLLLAGPEPGERLLPFSVTLVSLWLALVAVESGTLVKVGVEAWSVGRQWRDILQRSQGRLHLAGGFTIKGGSAGLAFCLNLLLAVFRAHPETARRSWLWRTIFRELRTNCAAWAATGAVTAAGDVRPVVLEPKLRACREHATIAHLLVPVQREARTSTAPDLTAMAAPSRGRGPRVFAAGRIRIGFAAEARRLSLHRCRHVAQALLAAGGVMRGWRFAVNAGALAVTITMLVALPDLRRILLPTAAPAVVRPASPSPYYVWASLETDDPESFRAVLESSFWANRRIPVRRYGGAVASVRAEIPLRRLAREDSRDEEHGIVWIERRRRFLGREFLPGERVGSYSLTYLNRIGHE